MLTTVEKTEKQAFLDAAYFAFYTKPNLMRETGLCTACLHQKVCCLTSVKPVFECEECQTREQEGKTIVQPSHPYKDGPDNPAVKEVKFQGLCSNCENRYSCTSSKTEGGIWYCEEYC